MDKEREGMEGGCGDPSSLSLKQCIHHHPHLVMLCVYLDDREAAAAGKHSDRKTRTWHDPSTVFSCLFEDEHSCICNFSCNGWAKG
jgi:hypothetical protein